MTPLPPIPVAQYNMILGRDLLEALGLIMNFCNHTMTWEEATTHMKDYGSLPTLQAADDNCDEIYSTDVGNRWQHEWCKY